MKRIKSRFAFFIILSSLIILALNFTPIPEVKGAEKVFFEDNFENYNFGAFHSSGGWELWYNGAGTEHQVIVDNVSVSPTKSLKLLGLDMWAAFAAKRFTSSSNVIGFEVAVRVEETKGQSRDDARVSFTKKLSDSISREYALVTFQDDGTITSGGQVLQSYVDDTWYKIKLIMNRDSETYSVWVDGELKGENLAVKTTSGDVTAYPSYEIEAFSVSQCFNSVTAYFDDVKVFSVFEVNPKLELVPAKGIAATTLVGSGFAPNSKISVTWDGTPIPTVPTPLITDGYGNFTAIISVLNQTDGTYTVKAVDKTGNEATATFTVTLGSPEQTQITVPDDYPTIQEAINHADEGDTIVVKAGTYYENVTVNKRLTIESQSGAETTIVRTAEPETQKTVFVITADNVVLKGFTITVMVGWGGDGIYLNEVENCVISDNTCLNNSAGISLYHSNNNLIANNNFSNNQNGLHLHQSNNNRIIGNIASKSSYGRGICLAFSSYNEILNNTVNENQDVGITLMERGTSNNVIVNNTVNSNHGNGIHLFAADNNKILNNTVLNNAKGIWLRGASKYNVVANNKILGNAEGIFLGDPSNKLGDCNGTIIYLNVLENSYNVYSYESTNFWNSTEKITYTYKNNIFTEYVGNYWSDYNGTDVDEDGIGDVPYVIDENNQDNHPLMTPWNLNENVTIGPNTWTVDDDGSADFHTIQEAINAADEGDMVLVFSGTYYENVIVNKTLTIESQSGAENTIVCTADPETGKNVFEITAADVEISGFTIKDSTNRTISGDPYNPNSYVDACGIYAGTCTGTKISRNIVKNNFEGIVFADCSDILVSENQITGNIHEGIRIVYSSSVTLVKNNIVSNHFPLQMTSTGLVVFHCSNSSVTENQIVVNDNGVVVSNSQGITVSDNSIIDNAFHGLNLVSSHSNTVFGNTMRNNTYGICPSGSTNTQIYENTLQENEYGIACYGASNNFVYHNYFINNSLQVSNFYGTETNSWDNGSEGNYWSDYNGTDTNEDGIGDIPYVIDENNQDNYPLMSPDSANPSLSYKLVVDSVPSGVTFTADNISCTAPWSETYNESTTVSLTMPESYYYEDENYTWSRWNDGNTHRTRTVTVNKNIALTAIFTPENTSLAISILSPENTTYSITDIPLKYTVNRFFYWTTYSLDGQANVTITGNTTLTGLSEGPHSIVVYIEDTPGNISSSETIYFTVVSASSGISILSPENKTYNTADVPLTYTKNVTCYYTAYSLDGQLYTDTENTTLSGLTDGTHELTVYANYTDSHISESATVWFTVDTTPPNITDVVQAPVNINGKLEEETKVNATVTDSVSGVERVSLNYTDGNGTWMIAEMTNLEGDVWNGTIPAFPHGTNLTYIIIAEDKAGNTVTTEELYGHPNQYEVLPEFPLWIILPLFLIATASTIAVRKRIHIPDFAKICNSLHKLLN
jgi:parallel beta-helix repeat protein